LAAGLPAVVEALAADRPALQAAHGPRCRIPQRLSSNYLLQIVIRRFEADYSGSSTAPRFM